MIEEFAKMLVKATEEEIIKIADFIRDFEETVKELESSNKFLYSELSKFDDIIKSKIKKDLTNGSESLIICVSWINEQYSNCTNHEPCNGNYCAPICDRQVALLNSIQEIKDVIMVNAPYASWCKYFI